MAPSCDSLFSSSSSEDEGAVSSGAWEGGDTPGSSSSDEGSPPTASGRHTRGRAGDGSGTGSPPTTRARSGGRTGKGRSNAQRAPSGDGDGSGSESGSGGGGGSGSGRGGGGGRGLLGALATGRTAQAGSPGRGGAPLQREPEGAGPAGAAAAPLPPTTLLGQLYELPPLVYGSKKPALISLPHPAVLAVFGVVLGGALPAPRPLTVLLEVQGEAAPDAGWPRFSAELRFYANSWGGSSCNLRIVSCVPLNRAVMGMQRVGLRRLDADGTVALVVARPARAAAPEVTIPTAGVKLSVRALQTPTRPLQHGPAPLG
jgi:hypothetical protein